MARSDAFVHGYVVGIAVSSRGDGDDTNALPDAAPAPVKITFTRLRGQYTHPLPTPDAGAHGMFVLHDRVVCDVIPSGEHVGHLTSDLTDGKATATSTPGVWLITGQYRVSAAGHFPEFDIDVTAEHTPAAPLDLYSAVPYVPPPGATVQLVPLPPGGSPGQYLTPLVGGGHGWADAPSGGDGGTTDHALLTNRDAAGQHPIAAISGLQAELDGKADAGHNHDGTYVKPADLPAPQTWDTLPGKPPVIAAGTSATAARDAIGAGTSNLQLGTGPTTAAAGNHTHDDRYYTESEVDAALAGKAAATHSHPVSQITATGTPDGTTFLRGDGAWATPEGGGGGTAAPTLVVAPALVTMAPEVNQTRTALIPTGAPAQSTHYADGAGRLAGGPLSLATSVTVSDLAVNVTTGAASRTLRFGLYADAGGRPGGLIFDSGELDGSTAGMKSVASTQTLAPGSYWVMLTQGGNGDLRFATWRHGTPDTNNGSWFIDAGFSSQLPSSALPADLSTAPLARQNPGGSGSGCPILYATVTGVGA